MEKMTAAALQSPALMRQLGLSDAEISLALVDPGLSFAAITTRMDSFVHQDQIKFVEYNAENPSSLSDQEGLNQLLFDLPVMTAFAKRYRLRQFSPVERLLDTLLASYREWGGMGAPNIAILDWENLPTSNEFVLLRDHFAAHGVRTIICSPDDLDYRAGRQAPVRRLSYRPRLQTLLIHEFLGRYDDKHPLIRAYVNHDVCLVNPFRCKIAHKKASFEMLTDEEHQPWFTNARTKRFFVASRGPAACADRRTTRQGRRVDLLEFIRKNRKDLVLKPNDDYGGHGVYLGPHLDDRVWNDAIATALAGDYVVQDAVELQPEHFPVFGESDWKLQPMFVDTNPFLFRGRACGAMVRLSTSPIVNVTSGGGETGFFVIADEM